MNKLLLDDRPLIVLPALAKVVGLNEAIVLQQLHYWLQESNHYIDGRRWIYNTYEDWEKQFPFWSNKTIRRTITKLENDGLIITGNYNKLKIDKTKWYSIDYQKLSILTSPCGQNDQSMWSNCPHPCGQNDQTNNHRVPENTTDNVVVVNAHRFYQENFGVESPFVSECIDQWIDDVGDEIVIEAMKRALKQQKKWNYAEGILREWVQNNLRTIEDIEAYEREFHRKREGVNDREVRKHRRGVSRSSKEGGKSYEQALREAEEARRAWGWKG